MTGCGCTGFTHGQDCPDRPDRPLMTSQPAGTLNPDDLILAAYDLDLGKLMTAPQDATRIRATHHYAFRSGQWARLVTTVPGPSGDCYLVEFPDGVTDIWSVEDTGWGYEFSSCETAEDREP
jgi:hypothetical protein